MPISKMLPAGRVARSWRVAQCTYYDGQRKPSFGKIPYNDLTWYVQQPDSMLLEKAINSVESTKMGTELCVAPVAKQPDPPRDRLDLRVSPELRGRLQRQAERFGLDLSAYTRQALIRQLEADEATDPDRIGNADDE